MKLLPLVLVLLALSLCSYASSGDSTISQLPSKYISRIEKKSKKFESIYSRQSEKALSRLYRLERKMRKKLSGKSSEDLSFLADSSSFTSAKSLLTNRLGSSSSYVDSLSGTLQFLNGQKQLLAKSEDIQKAIKSVYSLQDQMKHAQDVKDFIKKRKAMLAQKLSGYAGASEYLGKYSKEVYYYGARLREYKTLLADRKQLETKAIDLLKKLPAYNDFLRGNSGIASLLNTLPGSGSIASLEGLQTRSMVAAMLQQRFGTGATGIGVLDDQLQRVESELMQQRTPGIGNVRQTVSQQMSSARSRMNQIREGSLGEDNAAEMPNFKPSPLKAKRLKIFFILVGKQVVFYLVRK